MRNAQFKVCDCMRKLRFGVRDCKKKVRFEVWLHEKCAVQSTIVLNLQIVLQNAHFSSSRTSNRLKMGVKNYISVILKPKRWCIWCARFKVCACMRKLRFRVCDWRKKVRFEVGLHEQCAVQSTIVLNLQIVLQTAHFSWCHTSNCPFFMQSHTFSCS